MSLPPGFRPLLIGIYALISWKFLSLGAIVLGASMLAFLEVRLEAFPLLPIGTLFLYVGAMALARLRGVLTQDML
jgi:hypothetical protein